MVMNKKLIVIEGFDRSGKDTLMQDLCKMNLPNTYVYFNNLEGLPSYDKEQDNFLDWLNDFITNQIKTINKLFDKYDTVIMTRFLMSDEVYSNLFNREHTCIKYISDLRKDIYIVNFCILFKDYDEYLDRINNIKEDIQYSKKDFDKICKLYMNELEKSEYHNIKVLCKIESKATKENILENFLSIYNYDFNKYL